MVQREVGETAGGRNTWEIQYDIIKKKTLEDDQEGEPAKSCGCC